MPDQLAPNLKSKLDDLVEGVLVNVQYACGCGFKTLTLKEAEEHVAKTFHTISCFSGSIAPETKLPRYTPYHHFVADKD